jgi:flagellar M-ring protein FliF
MSFDVSAYRRRAASIWAGFTSGQKTMLALALVGLVGGGFVFTRWAATPSYTPLYGNLAAADAASITTELNSRGVAYRLADGGATIMVPQDSVYQLRLDMSSKGLPTQGAPGYSLLDKQGITTSEFRQRVDYQRALEGELDKTIGSIDGVQAAVVHLVIPADDLFTADASKPTASVLLRGKPGAKFSPQQVQAIVHLVASSVEGLQPEAVTVADASGKVLSTAGSDGSGGDAQASKSKEFEDGLARSIEAMLTPVAGSGGAVVRVNASLDFDERSTTTERFEKPDPTAPLLSESTSKETFAGPGSGSTGGVLGGTAGATTTPGASSNYQKDQADRSFAVGKVTEQVKAAPGRVSRLSVAVLLDRKTKAAPAEIQALVTAAAGIDPARGDVVEVRQLTFDTSEAKAADAQAKKEAAAKSRGQLLGLARTVGVLLIVLVALFLAWRSAKRASVTRYPMPGALPAGSSTDVETLMAAMTAAAARPQVAPAPSESLPPGPPAPAPAAPLTIGTSAVSDEVGELIDRQPEEVAQILRGWLADRRS